MRLINKDKLVTLGLWGIIIVSAVTIVIYLIWSTVYKVEPKVLSIINYYNFPVEITFLDKSENLEPFQVKTYTIDSKDEFNIVTRKQDRTELSNITVSGLKLPEQVVQLVLSETKDYCYFNANVTSLYSTEDDQISQVNVLSRVPSDYFVFGVNTANINIYPGSSMPTEEDVMYREVKGHYPVKCGLAGNAKDLEKVVKIFSNYDHSEQIDYFNEVKEKIQNTQNEGELNSI